VDKLAKNIKNEEFVPRYRKFVGRHVEWDRLGESYLDLLRSLGLRPTDKYLDVACGCLRSGRFLIKYLDNGNYYGMDHHRWLIEAGKKYEVDDLKGSHFTVSKNFDFSEFGDVKFDFIWLGSLVIHLDPCDIKQCLENLKSYIKDNGVLYMTVKFNSIGEKRVNPLVSQPKTMFHYDLDEIKEFASGWTVEHSAELHNLYKEYLPFSIQTMVKLIRNR